jgi:phenylalanyl-tRNA synthetase beta chain
MRVPLSWLVELVPGLATASHADLLQRLTMAGLEVEGIETIGAGIQGPVVAARVLDIEELTEFKKPIRFVTVDAGAGPRGIVCGARNFAVGDVVAAALPGAVLPGDFAIAARTTYGRVSDGMICSVRELGIGDDHDGIWILPSAVTPGDDVIALVSDVVLDIAVSPDRGYALSLRGLAREAATAFGLPFTDPADVEVPAGSAVGGHPVVIDDPAACTRYVARTVTGLDRTAVTPLALQRRLTLAGMRSISVAVDVTNLVLLGLGQPLHAFDADKLTGPIVVRRAREGEKLVTLDGNTRALHVEDLVITDDSGPIALAGVMGGLATEITETTSRVLVESAHFDSVVIARTVARHGLASEASRRYERGVDDALAPRAAEIALRMLTELAGATPEAPGTDVDHRRPRPALTLPLAATGRKAGRDYTPEVVRQRLLDVGCAVTGTDPLEVTPPSWRPDLTGEAELTEEVIRLEGYDTLPSVLPRSVPGRGLTSDQRRRRNVGRSLAAAGYVEAVIPPWLSQKVLDQLGLPDGDDRRNTTRVANPLSDDQSLLRTTLLPGLLTVLARNEGRGLRDVGLFEIGSVFRPGPEPLPAAPRVGLSGRPSDDELAALEAALPHQPRRVAVVAAGQRPGPGWTGPGKPVGWTDAVEAAQSVARTLGLTLRVTADQHAPWHPGRCAALHAGDVLVGHAGELHPRVCVAFGVPARTVAAEIDLDLLAAAAPAGLVSAPLVSPFPPVGRDVALVVGTDVAAAAVEAALVEGAGPLLESLHLFDRYAGAQVGEGKVSLAYRLSLRAPDRTLTDDDANAARDAAVARAAELTGAVVRT